MKRTLGSFEFVMTCVLASLLLVGCSDEGSGTTSDKTSGASKKSISRSVSVDTAKPRATVATTTEVTKQSTTETKTEPKPDQSMKSSGSSTAAAKPEVKTEVTKESKTETKTEVKSEPKSDAKSDAKPGEGKVEVPAQPDEPASSPAKPQAKGGKPADERSARTTIESPARNDASPTATAADDAATPKFSTIASADDLTNELNLLVADAEKAVADEDTYKSQIEDRFQRDGDTIALVATALGLHDQENPVKSHASAIVNAAHKLSGAKDYVATKKAVADLKAATESGAAGGELKWSKIATLESLMKDEVPNINKKLKDGLRHFKKRGKEAAANAATMALIAENAKFYLADTQKPNEAAKWTEFANQLRATAGDIAAKVHAGDEAGATAGMEKLNQSCHDCHAVFNPDK